MNIKIKKEPFTPATISTILFELVLLFALVYNGAYFLRTLIIAIAFLWTVARRLIKGKLGDVNYLHIIWSISFLLLVLASRLWALNPQGIDDIIGNVIWSIMTSIVICDYVIYYKVGLKQLAKLIAPIAYIFLINAVLFGTKDEANRLSTSNNANEFGMAAATMMCFYIYLLFTDKNGRIKNIIICFALLAVSFLSGSRKSLLGIIIYGLCFSLFSNNNKKNSKRLLKLVLILAIILISYILIMNIDPLYNAIGNRVESTLGYIFNQESADKSTTTRINMIELATHIIEDNPVLGIGANNFKYYTYYNTYSHNGYMEIMCCFGLIGLIVYYLPIIKVLMLSIKDRIRGDERAIVPIALLLTFFICEIANVTYFSISDYCHLGLVFGLSYNVHKKRIEENSELKTQRIK